MNVSLLEKHERRIPVYSNLLYFPQVCLLWLFGWCWLCTRLLRKTGTHTKLPPAFQINVIFTWIISNVPESGQKKNPPSQLVESTSGAMSFTSFPHFISFPCFLRTNRINPFSPTMRRNVGNKSETPFETKLVPFPQEEDFLRSEVLTKQVLAFRKRIKGWWINSSRNKVRADVLCHSVMSQATVLRKILSITSWLHLTGHNVGETTTKNTLKVYTREVNQVWVWGETKKQHEPTEETFQVFPTCLIAWLLLFVVL